jgi:hypothetical protein
MAGAEDCVATAVASALRRAKVCCRFASRFWMRGGFGPTGRLALCVRAADGAETYGSHWKPRNREGVRDIKVIDPVDQAARDSSQ